MKSLLKLLNGYYEKDINAGLLNVKTLFRQDVFDYRYHQYTKLSVFLRSISEEDFDKIKDSLNSEFKSKLLDSPTYLYDYVLTALTKENRSLYFREIGFDDSGRKDSHFLALYGKLNSGNHIDILNRLKKLPVFEGVVNRILFFNISPKMNTYKIRVRAKAAGLPMYLASKDITHFSWCLENGADINKKTAQQKVYNSWLASYNIHTYEAKVLESYLKYNGLNCKEYLESVKNMGYLDAFNTITKSNVSTGSKITNYVDMLKALLSNDRDVYDNLESYKDLVSDVKYRDKNFLFHAISSNRLDWAEKIMDLNLVSNNDELNGKSALIYAIRYNKVKFVRAIIEKEFYSKKDLADGTEVFYCLIEKNQKLACEVVIQNKLPIDMSLSHPLAQLKSWLHHRITSEDYQLLLKKMMSTNEKKLMGADLGGVELKPSKTKMKV